MPTPPPDPAAVPLSSPKGQERAARIRKRIETLADYKGWEPKAEASAMRWVLARLEAVELELEVRRGRISQAQAVEIIRAWSEAGDTMLEGEPVLDGLDLEELGIW